MKNVTYKVWFSDGNYDPEYVLVYAQSQNDALILAYELRRRQRQIERDALPFEKKIKKMREAEKEIKELESNGWRKISHVRREPPLEFYFLFERMIK